LKRKGDLERVVIYLRLTLRIIGGIRITQLAWGWPAESRRPINSTVDDCQFVLALLYANLKAVTKPHFQWQSVLRQQAEV